MNLDLIIKSSPSFLYIKDLSLKHPEFPTEEMVKVISYMPIEIPMLEREKFFTQLSKSIFLDPKAQDIHLHSGKMAHRSMFMHEDAVALMFYSHMTHQEELKKIVKRHSKKICAILVENGDITEKQAASTWKRWKTKTNKETLQQLKDGTHPAQVERELQIMSLFMKEQDLQKIKKRALKIR